VIYLHAQAETWQTFSDASSLSTARNYGLGVDLNSSTSTNITKDSHFTVTILHKPTPQEILSSFTAWTVPLSSLWTFVAAIGAIMAPFIYRIFKSQNKKSKYKKLDEF